VGVCREELNRAVGVVEEGDTPTTLAGLIDGRRTGLMKTGPVGNTGVGLMVTRLYQHVEERGGGGVETRRADQY
jgi:hypothetical protein